MSLKDLVKTGTKIKPRKTVIYSAGGIGKSTFAADAPNPIFIKTEDGLNDIDTSSFDVSKDFDNVVSNLTLLCNEEHEYKTVVIDSLDFLETLIFDKVCEENGVNNISKIGYGRGPILALSSWNRILSGLDYLLNEKSMSVILICHEAVSVFSDPTGGDFSKYTLSLDKRALALIKNYADEVFFATTKIYVKDKDDRGKSKVVGNGERIIKTGNNPACDCKNRLGMPNEIELKYEVYQSYIDAKNK